MKYLFWIIKVLVFLVLFAFSIQNQEPVTVRLLLGTTWQSPLVLVVLAAFTFGLLGGILVMMPLWWKARKELSQLQAQIPPVTIQPSKH